MLIAYCLILLISKITQVPFKPTTQTHNPRRSIVHLLKSIAIPTVLPSPIFKQASINNQSVMDTINVHDVDIDTPKMKVPNRFHWDPHTFKIFLEECMTELNNGNMTDTYFKQAACQNICKRLLERTGKELDRNQMKNKWDIMRKEFKYYDRLTRLETGISTDPTKNIISASKEWWDEKIKEDKEYAKFKDKNLEVYQTYYEALFRDTVAVGDKAKVPCEIGTGSTPVDVQYVDITDEKMDTDGVSLFEDVDPFLTYDSSSMKRKGKKLTPRRDNKRKF
ncbi:uncharacterized protein LOC111908084 [Lactuca sativa]|uniref:uncharacterized protein LOC111908084 n=1 Tax=Lactuca sativa TaxID=4236 RepID=UPI000CD877A6|nr:uncharacterized protein LOC111908084 [Lactuca sativa]